MNLLTPKHETWLYRLNPALKFIVFTVVLMFTLFTWHFEFAFYQMIVYMLLLITFSGHTWLRVLLFTSPFILVFFSSAFTMILFGKGETIWWSWGLIRISKESVQHGLLLGFKTLSFGALGMAFALTSRPILFFYAMMQQFRLPPKYAYSFIASIRMFPMIWEDLQNRTNALKVRGVQYAGGIRGAYERLSVYAVPLLAQSIRRAQRVAIAMEAKQFQLNAARTYYYLTSLTRLDALFVAVMLSLLLVCYLAAQLFPII